MSELRTISRDRQLSTQAMQIGRSPNDVRALYTEGSRTTTSSVGGQSQISSQSIKIVPNEQSSLEQQLCENEARAYDREYAMYQRILSGRNGFENSSSYPHLTSRPMDIGLSNHDSLCHPLGNGQRGIVIQKTISHSQNDSLIGALRYSSSPLDPVLSDPHMFSTSRFTYFQNPLPAENNDDGVFDFEM